MFSFVVRNRRNAFQNVFILIILLFTLFCMDVFPFKTVQYINREFTAVTITPKNITSDTKTIHIQGKIISHLGRGKKFQGKFEVEGYDFSRQGNYELYLPLTPSKERGFFCGSLFYIDASTLSNYSIGVLYIDSGFHKLFLMPIDECDKIYVAPANDVTEAYALLHQYPNLNINFNNNKNIR